MIQFIFNSLYSFDNFGIIAKTVNRPLLPAKRRTNVIIPGRNGSYTFDDNTYDDIVIPVIIQYVSDDFPDLRLRARVISAWLSQVDHKPLVFTDEPDKYYLAKIYDALSVEKIVNLVPGEKTTVQFECHPLAYSINPDVWLGQWAAEKIIKNGGTYETFPIIKISPVPIYNGMIGAIELTGAFDPAASIVTTLTNPIINVGSKTLVYTGTLTAGQCLEINTETFQAKKGNTNVLNNVSGDWPVFSVGDNVVSIHDSTSECGAAVEISFRKRWL